MTFSQGRGQMSIVEGKRLKSGLKELEEVMNEQPVIFSSWRSSSFLQVCIFKKIRQMTLFAVKILHFHRFFLPAVCFCIWSHCQCDIEQKW
jgi:hypothetical protein